MANETLIVEVVEKTESVGLYLIDDIKKNAAEYASLYLNKDILIDEFIDHILGC